MSSEEREPGTDVLQQEQDLPLEEGESVETTPAAEAPAEATPAAEEATATRERTERTSAEPSDRGRGRFRRRKVCMFCVEHVRAIDYKDPGKLRRYLSDRGRIEPRRKTGTCAKHQRWLSVALKRARHLALLPYTPEHIRLTGVFASRR